MGAAAFVTGTSARVLAIFAKCTAEYHAEEEVTFNPGMSRIACLAGCTMPVPASTRDGVSGSMHIFWRLVVVTLLCALPAPANRRRV